MGPSFLRAPRATTALPRPVRSCSFARWRGNRPTSAFASTRSALGWIDTRLGTGYLGVPERRAQVIATIPIGRVGLPCVIGTAAVFLAGDDASYVTGAHLRVDGRLAIGSDKT